MPDHGSDVSHQPDGLTDSRHELLSEVFKSLTHPVCDREREQAVCEAEAAQSRALGENQDVEEVAFSKMLFKRRTEVLVLVMERDLVPDQI